MCTWILARAGRCFWSSAVQVACRRPSSTTAQSPCSFLALGAAPSWSLWSLPVPAPPPSPHRPRLWPASCTCRANLPCARSCSSRNSIPARFPALNQTLVPLSLLSCPASACLCLRPSHHSPRWCMHLHRVRSLSTNWHLLGSDRDTKTKLGTNPSISSKLAGPQDRHLEPPARVLTPRPVQLLLSLCVLGARTSCFLGLHRVYFSSAVTPEIAQTLTHTPTHAHAHSHSHSPIACTRPPCALLMPAATCNRTPFTLDHTPASHPRARLDIAVASQPS